MHRRMFMSAVLLCSWITSQNGTSRRPQGAIRRWKRLSWYTDFSCWP